MGGLVSGKLGSVQTLAMGMMPLREAGSWQMPESSQPRSALVHDPAQFCTGSRGTEHTSVHCTCGDC
jgi:hypothetical protein